MIGIIVPSKLESVKSSRSSGARAGWVPLPPVRVCYDKDTLDCVPDRVPSGWVSVTQDILSAFGSCEPPRGRISSLIL